MFAVIYYVRLPQPISKDKYTFVHLLKESPYPALDALLHYITHMPSFYFVINSYEIRHQRNISAKIQKNIQKCDYRDGYVEVSCVIIILSFTS